MNILRLQNLFFFNSSIALSTKKKTKCSKDAVNYRRNSIKSKISRRTLPFNSSIQRLTNNLNAIQSTSTKKSIDLDPNKESFNLTFIEKSIVRSSYQIPNPTILLPSELPSSSKPITNSNMIINKIQRSTPIENNRNLLPFNQPNSFHLKTYSTDNTEELITNSDKISTTSISSLNLIHTISSQQIQISHHDGLTIHKSNSNSISSCQQNFLTKQSNVILPRIVDKSILTNRSIPNLSPITNDVTLSQDLKSPTFTLLHNKIDNENLQREFPTDTSPFEMSPQIKIHHEIKPESESLWETKLTLKTIISMANRDEAYALKNRKPIDYHMFLSSKFNKNSILQYDDHIDTKFTANKKNIVTEEFNEQDYKENRKLYKRLLDTMGLRKPINTKKPASMTSIKQIKAKRRTSITPASDNFLNETEKPVLITYQAIPISVFDK